METLNYYNNILLAPHKHLSYRRKRSLIDGVGYLANSLFGVLDQHFAEKYQQDIQAIQNNEKYLLELIKNQTTIIELENEIMKRNENHIQQQFTLLNKYMNDTETKISKLESNIGMIMATNYFSSVSLTAHLLLTNLKNIQEMLFNALVDVYKGHIDMHLLSPVNLIQQLNEISGKLPKTLSFPVENIQAEIKDVYKLLYVKARVTNEYFMFEIHIPLTSDEDYTLYRVIPLPLKTKDRNVNASYIHTSAKYIAVNFRQSTYMSVNEDEMKKCIQRSTNNFVCSLHLPVRKLESKDAPCEAKLLGHQTTTPCSLHKSKCEAAWIELHSTNTWLAVCCDLCILRSICGSDVTSHQINTSALITLEQGCTMQNEDMNIYAHNLYHSDASANLYLAKPPKLDKSINNIISSQRTLQLQLPTENENFEKVYKLLEQQKTNELHLPATITSHDIHQYTICYILLAVAVIAAFFWVVKRRGLCTKTTTYVTSTADLPKTDKKLRPRKPSLSKRSCRLVRSASVGERPRARNHDSQAVLAQREQTRSQPALQHLNDVQFSFEY